MIVREYYETRDDGVELYRTYSDTGMMVKQDQTGIDFIEAIDVDGSSATYTETDIPVPEGEGVYLTTEEALDIILGEEE